MLNGQELRWFDKFEDFDNNFPPEKSLQLPAITSIVSGEGNAKFPHQLAILAGEVKWELRCATEEEAENWVGGPPLTLMTPIVDFPWSLPNLPSWDFRVLKQMH